MKSSSQLNFSNLGLQLETSKHLEELNQSLPQNIRVTDYDLEQSLEDQQFRNQLEFIKFSQSQYQFKSNMDDFKFKKDNNHQRDSCENIDSPDSTPSSTVKDTEGKDSQLESIHHKGQSQQSNQLKGNYKHQKFSLQNTIEDQALARYFQSSNTCKNFISTQAQNETSYLSPQVNKSFSLLRSSVKENTLHSHSLSRSASKKRSTLMQIKNMQTLNPNIQRPQQPSQSQTWQPEILTEEQKSKNQNIIEYLNGKDKKPYKRNLLKQIYYIRRITNILKQRLDKKRIFQLNQQHYNVINDKSYFYSPIQKPKHNLVTIKFIGLFTFFFDKILSKLETFSPDSFFIMWLNIIILIIQFVQLVVYPLKSAFQIQELKEEDTYDNCFHYFPISMGILEICIHFNISFYDHGSFIQSRGLIFWKYLQNKFFFDIICVLLVHFNYYSNYFVVDIVFAIFSVKKIIMNLKNINDHFQIEQRFSTSYDLLKLSLLVFCMGHYCACGYFYIGKLYSPNWIYHYGFSNEIWIYNYVNSLYFTFITMITVGFGDIAPINMYEKIYVIFMTVVSCGVFAYAVNTIGRIFSEMALKEATYKNKKFEITKLMQQRNISKKTQRKVLKYIEYEQNQEVTSHQKGEEILLKISKSLRDEVNREYFGKFLNDIKLFKLNFSLDFITKLTSHIKERTYGPNEIIFSQGDLDRNFYFICNGSVQLYLNSKNSQNRDDDFDLISVGKGSLLGINSFLTGNPKEMSAKSLNVSHLVYCSEADFLSTIKMFEMDYEKYCMLRDSVNLYKDHQGLPCFSCQKFDHQAAHCSLYNLRVDKELVNLRHIYCPKQTRNSEGRKMTRRKNVVQALSHKSVCQISLKRLRMFYVQEIYGFSDDDEDDDEEEDDESKQSNELGTLTYSQYEQSQKNDKSITSQKLTLEDRINLYKDDKDFFHNVQKIRQKDLQLFILHKNSSSEIDLNLSYIIQNEQSQYDEDDTEENDEKFQTNSLSTPVKYSSESSFKIQSNQKIDKNNPSLNQSLHQKNIDSQNHYPSSSNFSKQGQDSNLILDVRNKSISNSSQHEQSPGINNVEGKRQSVYKQLNFVKQRQSMSINNDHDLISPNSKTQQSNNSLIMQEDENNHSEKMHEISLMKKKFKFQKQPTAEMKESQQSEIESISSIQVVKPVNIPNTPKKSSQDYKKRMSISAVKRRVSIQNKDGEIIKPGNNNHLLSILQDNWNSSHGYKQKFSTKYQLNSNILEFPAKHFDIFDQFDKLKDYLYYFPANNSNTILKEQRKKAYQVLVTMRYNKLQVNTKLNPSNNSNNFCEQEPKSSNPSPKKLTAIQQLLSLRQQQSQHLTLTLQQVQLQLSSSSSRKQ